MRLSVGWFIMSFILWIAWIIMNTLASTLRWLWTISMLLRLNCSQYFWIHWARLVSFLTQCKPIKLAFIGIRIIPTDIMFIDSATLEMRKWGIKRRIDLNRLAYHWMLRLFALLLSALSTVLDISLFNLFLSLQLILLHSKRLWFFTDEFIDALSKVLM